MSNEHLVNVDTWHMLENGFLMCKVAILPFIACGQFSIDKNYAVGRGRVDPKLMS